MKRSYLIQRLKSPHEQNEIENMFSFGGGLKNGGLSEKAMDLINQVWQFDYMGPAEFEWGAIPETLYQIAKTKKQYTSWEIKIKHKPIIYVIGKSEWKKEINDFIKSKTETEYSKKYHTKETVALKYTLEKIQEKNFQSKYDIVGWLELDNGYFFFIDKQMFDNTKKLFNIK